MTMLRTVATGSLLISMLLSGGGCKRFQERQEARRADRAEAQRLAETQAQPQAQSPAQSAPGETRTVVVDERPSTRYLVNERPAVPAQQSAVQR